MNGNPVHFQVIQFSLGCLVGQCSDNGGFWTFEWLYRNFSLITSQDILRTLAYNTAYYCIEPFVASGVEPEAFGTTLSPV